MHRWPMTIPSLAMTQGYLLLDSSYSDLFDIHDLGYLARPDCCKIKVYYKGFRGTYFKACLLIAPT